jgi:hypothetical protein
MKDKLKELAIAHAEKAVVGLCLLLMLSLLLGAFAKKPYHRTDRDFAAVTQRAQDYVRRSTVAPEQLASDDLKQLANDAAKSVDGTPHGYGTPWIRPFDFADAFRNEPKILAPSKPIVQDNRGLLGLFKTDLYNKRITRKVKAKDTTRRFAATGVDPQMGMAGMFGRMAMNSTQMSQMFSGMSGGSSEMMSEDMFSGESEEGDLGESSARMTLGMEMAGDALMGGMMAGGEGYMNMMGMGGGMTGKGAMFGMMGGGGPALRQPQVQRSVAQRTVRFIVPREVLENIEKVEDKDKKAKKEEEKEIEEYVETMVGRHWVEIVATFPHAEQIKEYVKALREPAPLTGLRYALARVERRMLLDDLTWSDWGPIDVIEQFRVVANAIDYEPEENAWVVMDGLAMNIPFVQTAEKPFLHQTVDALTKAEEAEYTPEEMNPRATARRGRRPSKAGVTAKPAPGDKQADAKAKLLGPAKGVVALKAPTEPEESKDAKGSKDSKKQDEAFDNRFKVKTAMIRFWDFTVVPGRRYQYRVRAKVFNPNFGHPDVADRSYAAGWMREGPWSEPSDEVYVAPDVKWFVPDPKAPADRAAVQVHFWLRECGEWIVADFTHRPGDMIGQTPTRQLNETVRWDEATGTWKLESMSLAEQMSTANFVLDVWGGQMKESLGGQIRYLKLPKEVVAVNEFGDIIRRESDTDSADSFHRYIADGYASLIKEMQARLQGKKVEQPSGIGEPAGKLVDPTAAGRTKKSRGKGGESDSGAEE